ncbi:MAG: hypothetical protein DLM53_09405 [Candidatus Eremiobacter antarcticus]|nr:hypothetical protein [Candidatus Eremiobacteraeota bacterium]MBC5807512.1 hypothetical protein [Candidatus Eremiobacteraeota bacterium]PZR61493.1 MAG: hypothetical protein DLM53_09405 [Candidatus Eremiobacter sp. RRmetagenome_bin22]
MRADGPPAWGARGLEPPEPVARAAQSAAGAQQLAAGARQLATGAQQPEARAQQSAEAPIAATAWTVKRRDSASTKATTLHLLRRESNRSA